jgi:guanosine-3',5'-bis(diphosphate) 3'-pyrophosphohydrolase
MTFLDADGLVIRALYFAAEKHVHQRRKGEDRIPYINHPIAVAEILWRVGEVRDPAVLAGALLHDTIEDTDTRPEEIEAEFGTEILALVLEMTDNKSLPKSERKQMQIDHAPTLSPNARLIKLADKTHNIQSLTDSPPEGWSDEWKRNYLAWARSVVEQIRGANPALEAYFDKVCSNITF